MAAGQRNGSGAMANLEDAKVRKNDILSNRQKSQRPPGQSLDSTGVRVEEYKDIPTNQRPPQGSADEQSGSEEKPEEVDRPGFDLGGATGDTSAGKGLGLGTDAKEDREDWRLPRERDQRES